MGELFKTLFGVIAGPLFLVLGMGMIFFVFSTLNVDLVPILAVIIALSPIWLPFVFFYILFEQWMYFVRTMFAYKQGRTTLRIKLPQEVLKSPEAMESVITQVYNPYNADNFWQTYIDGKHPLNYSFELASIGGDVRFYVNVPTKKGKNAIEAQLYAQFPGIEVVEEPVDYAAEIKWEPDKWEMLSFHICKKKDDILPIKTYIDYKLDLQPKEELKFEPMSPMLEHLGKVKPHERMYIQFVCTAHVEKTLKTGSLNTVPTWEGAVKKKVNEMMGRDDKGKALEETENRPILSMMERDTITAMERNASKRAFEVGVRAIYLVEKGKFDADMITPLLTSFLQYEVVGRNAMGVRWRTDFDYNWFSDYSGARKMAMKKRELEAYKKRSWDDEDKKTHADRRKIMSAEELATMYHIPGSSVVTPGVTRVETARKEAPANLPT